MSTSGKSSAAPTGIPTYLLIPGPATAVPPPVETLVQDLPLGKLTWENFERLCLRIVESASTIEQCYEYGTRGQNQHGIDLLARDQIYGNLTVFQCKRVESFGPSDIKAAITKFLKEPWAATATKFVLCTSEDLRTTDCAEEITEQEKRLFQYKTGFEVWNSTRLSKELKNLPYLVYDFFGLAWLKAFCGQEFESQVSKRLSPHQIEQYRQRLATFYQNKFEQNDPGIPTMSGQIAPRISLVGRFVVPHLSDSETVLSSGSLASPNAFDLFAEDSDEFDLSRKRRTPLGNTQENRETTFAVDDWLSANDRALIVGTAGSGKTALLRYVLLNLLSSEPTLPSVTAQYGRNLPIWIPFAYWTRTLQRQPDASIVDVLRGWFHSWGEDDLFQLVKEAIEDERLLLIVDGLDEWVDEATGSLAFAQLETFLDMRGLPAVASARPYALNWLKLSGNWHLSHIARLSATERETLCTFWFRSRASLTSGADGIEDIQHDVSSLIADLANSIDLDELSRIPLFLLLLIAIRFQGRALPSGRFDAYQTLIHHMLRDHPQRKRSAAGIADPAPLSEREIQLILADLAFHIQSEKTGGTISESDFESLLINILTSSRDEGLNMSKDDARNISKSFLSIEEGSLGLLVPQGLRTFGFLHRSFQERLSAIHCSSKSLESQVAIVRKYANDPQWRETLLHLCSLTTRSNELSALLSGLSDAAENHFQREKAEDFRIEVAFSDFNLAAQDVKEIAILAFTIVEHSSDLERRRRTLRHCLNGLQAGRTRHLVQPKLNEWMISRASWRSNWFAALEQWPPDDFTKNILQRGLNDEEPYTVRAAGLAYAKVFRSKRSAADDLAKRALASGSVDQRAACIEALLAVWPEYPELPYIGFAAINTEIPLLQLLGLLVFAKLGTISQENAVEALELATDGIGGPIPYPWHDLRTDLLVQISQQYSSMIKQACIYVVDDVGWQRDGIDLGTAWFVLARSYDKDADVQSLLAKEIGKDHPFVSMHGKDVWRTIYEKYRGVEVIEKALDARIDSFNAAHPSAAHFAALVTRSSIAKNKMLQMLKDSFPHWAASALLEAWGMEDVEVATALEACALGDERRAAEIGKFIPRILGTPRARERLEELLEHPRVRRIDFVIAGLFEDEPNKHDDALITKAIKAIEVKDDIWDQNASTLVANCSDNPRVRDLAIRNLAGRNPSVAQVADSYANDSEIRELIAHMMTPLPRELRSDITAALSRSTNLGEHAAAILAQWDFEQDAGIKTEMSIGYHSHLHRRAHIPDKDIQALTDAAKSYGPDHEVRRQAAYCGAALLNKFDIYFSNHETIGDPTGLAIPLDRGLRTNYPFLDFLASHWRETKAAFGDEFMNRFIRFSNEVSAWTTLIAVADQNAEMRSDASNAVETYKDLVETAPGLRFLSQIKPRSSQLRGAALKAINASGDSWIGFLPIDAACEVLLKQFNEDRLYTDLERLVRDNRFNNGPMLAISVGWPECSLVQGLLSHLNEIDQLTAAYIFFSAASIDRIIERLPSQLSHSANTNYWGRYIRRPLLMRLARDPELCAALQDDLIKTPTPWKRCAYPHAIARTQGLSDSAREWVIDEYNRQSSLDKSEFGYDMVTSEIRSARYSLIDALGGSLSYRLFL